MLHHEHTSYRALTVIFILSGFFIISLNVASRAAADQFGISAMVMAPIPTTPPIINSPQEAAIIKEDSLLVTGSCPLITPQVIVSVAVDGTQAGTAACDSNNDFSVPVSVDRGVHKITASTLTISGQEGPTSSPVTITVPALGTSSPITLTAAQPFIYVNSRTVTWSGSIQASNTTADHVHIDWGDGSVSDYTVQPGAESFTHQYATLASHNILLDVASANDNSTFEQFGAATFTSYTAPVAVITQQRPFFETSTIFGLYGLYITALSIMGIIWLEAKHNARQHHIPA